MRLLGTVQLTRILLLCAWCAWLVWTLVWSIHPESYYDWNRGVVMAGLAIGSGLLIVLAVSVGALFLRKPAIRLMRLALTLHLGASGTLLIAAFLLEERIAGLTFVLFLLVLVDISILILVPRSIDSRNVAILLHAGVFTSISGCAFGLFLWSEITYGS
jgi:hypothetical protein